LWPVEELPSGSLIHRIIHQSAGATYVPCRKSKVDINVSTRA
jgi:hypothetical protein